MDCQFSCMSEGARIQPKGILKSLSPLSSPTNLIKGKDFQLKSFQHQIKMSLTHASLDGYSPMFLWERFLRIDSVL